MLNFCVYSAVFLAIISLNFQSVFFHSNILLLSKDAHAMGCSTKTNLNKSVVVRGVYSLMKVNGQPAPKVFSLSYVEGVSVRARWNMLQPEYGKYDWQYIDSVLNEAKKRNKKVMIRILPGVSSPSWIYDEGVKKVNFTPHRERKKLKFGNYVSTPLMWDKRYIELWNEFISAFAKKYRDESSIVMVHMAGPTVYSAEMHLLKSKEGKELLKKANYSKDKIVDAWKLVINNYSENFTSQKLSLNIALPFRKDGALEEIVNYSISKLGSRLAVQGNWLKASTKEYFLPYNLISDLNKTSKVEIGFQMAWPSKNNTINQGSLDQSVKMGLLKGARYFELYEVDILDKKNKEYLMKLNNDLTDSN